MRREEKIEKAKELKELFNEHRYFVFFDFTGINVEQINNLRSSLRKSGSLIKVVKNRIAKKILSDTPAAPAEDWLSGPTAVVFIKDDVGKAVKELYEFSKEAPLKFKGFVLEGQKMGPEKAEELSKLPTREELLAKFAAAMAAPLVQFGRALSMPLFMLGNALSQLKDIKEKGE